MLTTVFLCVAMIHWKQSKAKQSKAKQSKAKVTGMNKKVIIGSVAAAIVVAGGVSYAVLHTPKAQFGTHLLAMIKADDNRYQYTASMPGNSQYRINGLANLDAKDRQKLMLSTTVADDDTKLTYDIKKNGKTTYVSAGFLSDMFQSADVKDVPDFSTVLQNVWMKADNKRYAKVESEQVQTDAKQIAKWFTDLDGQKFSKVGAGYQVKLNRADLKRLVTVVGQTETAKQLKDDGWDKLRDEINDMKKPEVIVTVAKDAHKLSLRATSDQAIYVKASVVGTRQAGQTVVMPAAKHVKTEKQLEKMLTAMVLQYAFNAMSDSWGE